MPPTGDLSAADFRISTGVDLSSVAPTYHGCGRIACVIESYPIVHLGLVLFEGWPAFLISAP